MPNCGSEDEPSAPGLVCGTGESFRLLVSLAADEQNMAPIEPLTDAQPAAQILRLLPVTGATGMPNGSMESRADNTLSDLRSAANHSSTQLDQEATLNTCSGT